jgi:hypothetical protein
MNAAALEGRPRGGLVTSKKTPLPPCLGESLKRRSFLVLRFSQLKRELDRFIFGSITSIFLRLTVKIIIFTAGSQKKIKY